MSCPLDKSKFKVKAFDAIRKEIGNNEELLERYVSFTVLNDFDKNGRLVPTEAFKKYLEDHGITDFSFYKSEGAGVIREFVRQQYKTLDDVANLKNSSQRLDDTLALGYSSIDARIEAVNDAVVFGLSYIDGIFRQSRSKVKGDIKTAIKNGILGKIRREFAIRILESRGVELPTDSKARAALLIPEMNAITKQGLGYVREALGGNISLETKNLIALYVEATGENTADAFFRKVLVNEKFASYQIKVNDEFKEAQIVDDNGQEIDEDTTTFLEGETDRTPDEDTDNTMAQYDHSGSKKDVLDHVDEEIKTYLSTLPKLVYASKSDGRWVVAKTRFLGVTDVMDASQSSIMLYREADFTNWRTMIESIKRIAERHAGFEAFAKLAEDLTEDTDLCFKFYNTFAKMIFSKMETVVEDGNTKVIQSNQRSSKTAAMVFDMLNSIRSTSVAAASINIDALVVKCYNYASALKDINSSEAREYIANLTELFSIYFPTIDKYCIKSFIETNADEKGIINFANNYKALYDRLLKVIEASKESYINYVNRSYRIKLARRKVNEAIRSGEFTAKSLFTLQNELTDAINEPYVSKETNVPLTELANLLAPFAAISVELNSRNVYGNLSSDVLNNNMLTNLMNTLKSVLNKRMRDSSGKFVFPTDCPLANYGKFKFAGSQHLLSNILVEHTTPDGQLIRGLFRLENGEYVPTSYATELLDFEHFSGATSFDTGKNILYSEMSGADYLTTAFLNFRNSGYADRGKYFMRIPSDAPKTFLITAPKYSIDGLNKNGVIDVNHPIFVQLRNAFKQELIDMAVALDEIFVLSDNGVIARNGDNSLRIKDKYQGPGMNRLYKQYHYDGTSITKIDDNGREVVTGHVFESVRFTVFNREGNVKENYGQRIVNQIFDFLYGGSGIKLEIVRDDNGKIVDVNTAEYDEVINKELSEFIAAYTKEAIARMWAVREFIYKADKTIKEDADLKKAISEFVLNNHIMYINFDDLFEGSSKFYKNSQDFLKRAKEVQGAGTPYGVVDYSRPFNPKVKTRVEGVTLNNRVALTKIAKSLGLSDDIVEKLLEIGQYDSFSAVTVVNTIKQIPGTEKGSALEKSLIESILAKSENKDRKQAEKRAREILDGYRKTKVNDAQSYITFEEWVRRVSARGQLGRYLPTILKILDESQPITPEIIEEFVQVQKNFYYDLYYDEVTNTEAPRQIKNAEFVLIPRFIEGTELAEVYRIMKEHKIDQLNTEETSKAGKHNVLELWDKNGNLNVQAFNDNFNDEAIEYYSYNFLYTQQETPQHVNAKNKAAIQLMKKVLDNIPKGHKLYGFKEQFMKLYSIKIYKAFDALMTELNVPRDANGNIIIRTDLDTGREYIEGLNMELLFSKFREQAERLGTTTNLIDYLTLDEFGLPKMPNFFNGTANKIENIAQALFNSAITRQKLPGFHAAQITQVGWKKFSKDKGQISTADDLEYHPVVNGVVKNYIEIRLPKSAFGFAKNEDGTYKFSDEELLKQLEKAGLDKIIGYRIPTEGKQSICIMKVKGFIDDVYGSTIVVPDGWVAQTGSDFDIDSIYGVNFATYIDKDGHIQKIKYIDKKDITTEERTKLWRRMVRGFIGSDFRNPWNNKDERIKAAIRKLKKGLEETKTRLAEASAEAFEELSDREQYLIKAIHDKQRRHGVKFDRETLAKLMANEIELIRRQKTKISPRLQNYINAIQAIINNITFTETTNEISDAIKTELESIQEDEQKLYEDYAKERGLPSLEDYLSRDSDEIQSDDALSNQILQDMLSILGDDSSMEENVSRSQFEGITDSRDKTYGLSKDQSRQSRSVYNIIDQSEFMDDATAGLKLKGFSVTRDNLCSICNTIEAVLYDTPVVVEYPKDRYVGAELERRFGKDNVHDGKTVWIVTHNRFGWSGDNRTVDGEILTIYSSETTAHILDNIKEGSIPNVNDFSFGVYKTFVDLGCNYDTAIGFMLQPAVTRIINNYKKGKSIYTSGTTRPILAAFKEVAKLCVPSLAKAKKLTTKQIIKALNGNVNVIAVLSELVGEKVWFAYDKGIIKIVTASSSVLGGEEEVNVPLSVEKLKERFFANTPVEEMSLAQKVFDLMIISKFSRLYNISQNLTKYAQVLNPDKFGAKQTIFATNKVFSDIDEAIRDTPVLTTRDGINILQAVYPGIEEGIEGFMASTRQSVYPTLCNFLKYSSAPSVVVNRQLFETQRATFTSQISRIRTIFGRKQTLTEKLYKDFEKHVISYLYTEIPFIKYALTLDKDGKFQIDHYTDVDGNEKLVRSEFEELQRVRGFGLDSDFTFKVKDFYNPTEEEIKAWNELSPAQKVSWLQSVLKEPGIFGYIKADLQNRRRNNTQTLEFTEGVASIEDIYTLFNQAFYKTNPLVRLAMADIIKYAFQVEGFRMTQKAVNKIIQNEPLMEAFDDFGTGIVNYMRQRIHDLQDETIDYCIDTYVRGKHPRELARVDITTSPLGRKKSTVTVKGEQREVTEDFYYAEIDFDPKRSNIADFVDAGLAYYDNGSPVFVDYFITTGKKPITYKVKIVDGYFYAYPLNDLEPNEHTVFSANTTNNVRPSEEYYLGRISGEVAFADRKAYAAIKISAVGAKNSLNLDKPSTENEAKAYTEFMEDVIENSDDITERVPMYFFRDTIAKHIIKAGKLNGSPQVIDGIEYMVYKYIMPSRIKEYFKGGKRENVSVYDLPAEDKMFSQVISKLRSLNYTNEAPDVVLVGVQKMSPKPTGLTPATMNADIDESVIRPIETILYESRQGDEISGSIAERITKAGLSRDISVIHTNVEEAYQILHEYVKAMHEDITDKATHFVELADNTYGDIASSEAINLIRNNKEKRLEFLKLILDIRKLQSLFDSFIRIPTDNPELKVHIEAIDRYMRDFDTPMYDETWKLFTNEYLAKLSTNPLVQQDIITLLDGYYASGPIEALINDTQEMPNPLIQIITKEVMADIRSRDMEAQRQVIEFRNRIQGIIDDAIKHGADVNWDNLVDKDGRLYQPFVKKFLDDYSALRRKLEEIVKDPDKGEGSIEYLEAELELEEWMKDHVEQAFETDYYEKLIRYKRTMLGGYKEIYSAYRKLNAERRKLRGYIVHGSVDPAIEDRLKEIDREIQALKSEYVFDGATFYPKPSREELPANRRINSREDAIALSNYLANLKSLHEEYNSSEENAGFEETFRKKKEIVDAWEARDAQSRLTTHPIVLEEIEEYRVAKAWLRKNARYVEDEEITNEINAAFAALGTGEKSLSSVGLRRITRALNDYYDEYGRGDGRKLSPEQQVELRNLQNKENARRASTHAGSVLLNSAARPEQIYTTAFYGLLTVAYDDRSKYKHLIEDINNILKKHYDVANRRIIWNKVTSEEYIELQNLYKQLAAIKNRQKDAKNVDVEWSDGTKEFEIAKAIAVNGGVKDLDGWLAVNTETIIDDKGNEKVIPNRFIYSYQKPTARAMALRTRSGRLKYIDEKKTQALATLRNYCVTEPTTYYYRELERRRKQDIDGVVDADGRTFQQWFDDNHTYNPINGAYSPIKCWMQTTIIGGKGKWEASFNQRHTTPKPEHLNPKHKKGQTLGVNYKRGSGYDAEVHQNEYEQQIQDVIYNLLIALSKNNAEARRFFERGNLPVMSKEAEKDYKYYLKELAKLGGWIETAEGNAPFDTDMSYNSDTVPTMPMTTRLKNTEGVRLEPVKPKRENCANDEEYERAVAQYEADKKTLEEQDDEYHRKMQDRDWVNVISDFILRAAHYNAIQDNKYMLYYGQEMLKNVRNYVRHIGNPNIPKAKPMSENAVLGYQTERAKNEYEQYTNWMRRLILNQWRKPNGRFTRVASIAQSLTSANFMMMNIRGGIANITLGETNIMMEAIAKEYFNPKDYAGGKGIWMANVANFFINRHRAEATTVADAAIKWFDVIDFDEIRGVPRVDIDPSTYLTRLRNFMFSPQTIGEHFMQNGVLFTMLLSHKLYENAEKDKNGRTSWVAKGRADVIRDAHEIALLSLLNADLTRDYLEFKKSLKLDPNKAKDYAEYRADPVTTFLMLHKDLQKQFVAIKEQKEKEALEDFDKRESLWEQLELTEDGMLGFKDGSKLKELDVKREGEDASEAYQILGAFKGKVISVNKKIHGVYDKLGSAQIENNWLGPLVMQYHKHIVPNVLKRWRRHGYYNEERQTVEKGSHIALIDFLSIPFRKHKEELQLNEAQTDMIEFIQGTFTDIADFCQNITLYYRMLPAYEQANIRRNLGDLLGVLSALCFAIALRALADDDDEDNRLYNLALYECDRLASETMQFNPLGAISEAKKLWSNPVAVQSIVNDIMSSMGIISQMIMEGEDFDPYYHSGKYAGEHKLTVRVRRRIPIWRGIDAIINIADDNHYYKLGDNMLSVVPVKRIADWIKE